MNTPKHKAGKFQFSKAHWEHWRKVEKQNDDKVKTTNSNAWLSFPQLIADVDCGIFAHLNGMGCFFAFPSSPRFRKDITLSKPTVFLDKMI